MREEGVKLNWDTASCTEYNSASLTCADDLLNLHTGDVDLFSELTHSFVRVLVGEGINVHLCSGTHYWGFNSDKQKSINYMPKI